VLVIILSVIGVENLKNVHTRTGTCSLLYPNIFLNYISRLWCEYNDIDSWVRNRDDTLSKNRLLGVTIFNKKNRVIIWK